MLDPLAGLSDRKNIWTPSVVLVPVNEISSGFALMSFDSRPLVSCSLSFTYDRNDGSNLISVASLRNSDADSAALVGIGPIEAQSRYLSREKTGKSSLIPMR